MKEFVASLYLQLETELNGIAIEETETLALAKRSYLAAQEIMIQLKAFISSYDFTDAIEETYFFKVLKPRFYGKLIYYVRLFEIESQRPCDSTKSVKKYFNTELSSIKHFTEKHAYFYKYCRSGATHMDDIYFKRDKHDILAGFDISYFDSDQRFCASYDLTLATLSANELLAEYLSNELKKLKNEQRNMNPSLVDDFGLNWVDSKASFIELLYGLQTLGVFYNTKTRTKADMSQVARFFETVLNVDLGNYYRTFQEIRIRKKGRTAFVDKLREQLIKRMDDADEHPKF